MLTSVSKSQENNSSLDYLRVNDWENGEIKIKVEINILHLVTRDLQGSDWDYTEFKKWGQYNELGFCFWTRSQDMTNQRWCLENQRHYSGDLWNVWHL